AGWTSESGRDRRPRTQDILLLRPQGVRSLGDAVGILASLLLLPELAAAEADADRPVAPHDQLGRAEVRVGHDRHVLEADVAHARLTVRVELPDGLALRVAPDATVGITRGNADLVVVDEVDVVVRVAAIGIEVDAAVAADGIRMGAEEP